jgi:hypothetical protein
MDECFCLFSEGTMDAFEMVWGMEDVEADLNMLERLKNLLVTVWVDGVMEGVTERVSGAGAGVGAEPKRPSKGLRRLVSLRVMGGGS